MFTVEGKNCRYLSQPEGTNRTSDAVEAGTKVTYQCVNWGDSFSDQQSTELEVRCLDNGEWDPLPHPCKRKPSRLKHYTSVSRHVTVIDLDCFTSPSSALWSNASSIPR